MLKLKQTIWQIYSFNIIFIQQQVRLADYYPLHPTKDINFAVYIHIKSPRLVVGSIEIQRIYLLYYGFAIASLI